MSRDRGGGRDLLRLCKRNTSLIFVTTLTTHAATAELAYRPADAQKDHVENKREDDEWEEHNKPALPAPAEWVAVAVTKVIRIFDLHVGIMEEPTVMRFDLRDLNNVIAWDGTKKRCVLFLLRFAPRQRFGLEFFIRSV